LLSQLAQLSIAVRAKHVEHPEAALHVGPPPGDEREAAWAELALQQLADREKVGELLSPSRGDVAVLRPLFDCLTLHAEQLSNLARVQTEQFSYSRQRWLPRAEYTVHGSTVAGHVAPLWRIGPAREHVDAQPRTPWQEQADGVDRHDAEADVSSKARDQNASNVASSVASR
jgi:hypothetical protein